MQEQEQQPVFVLQWVYADRSASGLLPYVFTNREEAERMFTTLQDHSDKLWYLNELELM